MHVARVGAGGKHGRAGGVRGDLVHVPRVPVKQRLLQQDIQSPHASTVFASRHASTVSASRAYLGLRWVGLDCIRAYVHQRH